MPQAQLHDGNLIEFELHGEGPMLLLPLNPTPIEGAQAEQMRQYGTDPALGQSFIRGLQDLFRLVVFDYEGHVLSTPKPDTLTPDNIAADFLAVADAAGADRFAYYGYSWLAVAGLQLAIRTDRLSALILGGYPPLDGPYKEMMAVTTASYDIARGVRPSPDDEWSSGSLSEEQTRQFVTLYKELQSFDDRAIQARLTCPRLSFVGSVDTISYNESWGNVIVDIAGLVLRERTALQALGWDVEVLEGLNHMQAMQAEHVVPVIRRWWQSKQLHRQ